MKMSEEEKVESSHDKEDNRSTDGATGGTEAEDDKQADGKKKSLLDTGPAVSTSDWLKEYFSKALGISNEPPPEKLLEDVTLEGVAKFILSDRCQKIVTMAGAGISTSAGIPDFRSPGTGLYDNLQKYDLPHPQAVFDISYFQEHPEPFFMLAKELWPGTFKPTPCHYFIKLLSMKKKLLRHFTQNIDTLERVAGIPEEEIVEAHGTFQTSHCIKCQHTYNMDWMKEKIFKDEIPKCEQDCDGLVKPDIVFFGESLSPRFANCASEDLPSCDLLIILGTSLVVQPFASLTGRVQDVTPRLYINLEKTGAGPSHPLTVLMFGGGFAFDEEDNYRDVFWEGKCDDGCYKLSELLGWKEEFQQLIEKEHAKIDKASGASTASGTSKSPQKPASSSNPSKGKPKNSQTSSPSKPAPTKVKQSPKKSPGKPSDHNSKV